MPSDARGGGQHHHAVDNLGDRGDGGIGQVVGRDIDRLVAVTAAPTPATNGNALLKARNLCRKRRLSSRRARAGARRSPDTSLPAWMKLVDVVHQQQNVLPLLVAEIFRHGVRAASATRQRAPGGSFICPNSRTLWSMTPVSRICDSSS